MPDHSARDGYSVGAVEADTADAGRRRLCWLIRRAGVDVVPSSSQCRRRITGCDADQERGKIVVDSQIARGDAGKRWSVKPA